MRPHPSHRAPAAGQHLPMLPAPPCTPPRGQKSPGGVTQPPAPSCHHLSLLACKHFRKPKPQGAARRAGSDSALSQRCLQRGAAPSSALMSPLPPHGHASCASCQGHGAEITANKSISACRACFRGRANLKEYGSGQAAVTCKQPGSSRTSRPHQGSKNIRVMATPPPLPLLITPSGFSADVSLLPGPF